MQTVIKHVCQIRECTCDDNLLPQMRTQNIILLADESKVQNDNDDSHHTTSHILTEAVYQNLNLFLGISVVSSTLCDHAGLRRVGPDCTDCITDPH